MKCSSSRISVSSVNIFSFHYFVAFCKPYDFSSCLQVLQQRNAHLMAIILPKFSDSTLLQLLNYDTIYVIISGKISDTKRRKDFFVRLVSKIPLISFVIVHLTYNSDL